MVITLTKTKENSENPKFRKSNPLLSLFPQPLNNIERVKFANLLGVYFCDNLNFDTHIEFILTQCSQKVFLMKRLRDQGISDKNPYVVFQFIIISRLCYAQSAWGLF